MLAALAGSLAAVARRRTVDDRFPRQSNATSKKLRRRGAASFPK